MRGVVCVQTTPSFLLCKMAFLSRATVVAVVLLLAAVLYQIYRYADSGEAQLPKVHHRKEGKKRILIG